MNKVNLFTIPLVVGLLCSSLALPTLSEDTALPIKKEQQSKAAESVRENIDQAVGKGVEEKRKTLIDEAISAVNETKNALSLLDENKTKEAIKTLEKVTGKLELIIARDPELALAPVDIKVNILDLLASSKTIKDTIKTVEDLIEDGLIQEARPIMEYLASEIQYVTTSIPLETYPDAIKSISPLIDEGKIDVAKAELQMALNTLVITKTIVALPALRTEALLAKAEKLAEKKERSDKEEKQLTEALDAAREQLKIAQLLGYGDKKAYKPMYKEISIIKDKSTGGKSGKGWFEKIKLKLEDLV